MAFHITVQGGLDDGNTFRVEGQCIIGRAPRCQVLLSDPDVAWEHASLQDLSGRLFLQSLSAAGTKLKGHAVSKEARVVHGDEIQITPSCTLVVEEKIGKSRASNITPPVLAGILILVGALLFGGFKLLQPEPPRIIPLTLADWDKAVDRLTTRMEDWEERGEFPEEAINIFRDAWRFEMAYNNKAAAQRWDVLHSVLLTLDLPGSRFERRAIAEAAGPNQRALDVIMDRDPLTNMTTDPQWQSDEAFAGALTWFVRKRAISTNKKVKAAGQ